MLEELQRLQVHIGVLKRDLHNLKVRIPVYVRSKRLQACNMKLKLNKNSFIAQKQQEIQNLNQQLTESRNQFQHLNQDATALADRYSRLEKVVLILRTVFRKFWLNAMSYAC